VLFINVLFNLTCSKRVGMLAHGRKAEDRQRGGLCDKTA
jgi:hypothetical protein